MRVLIVDCAPHSYKRELFQAGGSHEGLFEDAVAAAEPSAVCQTINAAEGELFPSGTTFKDFDGAILTGSPLSAYEESPAIGRTIEFARSLFEAGVPSFGVCYGLQAMSAALGGSVRKNPNGREIGFARMIVLNENGRYSPVLRGRPLAFSALASHQDHVDRLPSGGETLASNGNSQVQVAEIRRGKSLFWDVQYHPEMTFATLSAIFGIRKQRMLEEGLFDSEANTEQVMSDFRAIDKDDPLHPSLVWRYGLDDQLVGASARRNEFHNWIDSVVRPHHRQRA